MEHRTLYGVMSFDDPWDISIPDSDDALLLSPFDGKTTS